MFEPCPLYNQKEDISWRPIPSRPGSNRRMTRQRDDTRAFMPLAARAAHVAKCNTDRSFMVSRLHTQIQIDHRPATVAGNNKPMMLDVSAAEIFGQNHE